MLDSISSQNILHVSCGSVMFARGDFSHMLSRSAMAMICVGMARRRKPVSGIGHDDARHGVWYLVMWVLRSSPPEAL